MIKSEQSIKLRALYKEIADAKQARSTKLLSIKQVAEIEARNKQVSTILCQATSMNGNPCKSRAVCGKYCRRHKF
jgi:hypothetical protein